MKVLMFADETGQPIHSTARRDNRRVHFTITGWVEVSSISDDDAEAQAADMTDEHLVANAGPGLTVDIGDIELMD